MPVEDAMTIAKRRECLKKIDSATAHTVAIGYFSPRYQPPLGSDFRSASYSASVCRLLRWLGPYTRRRQRGGFWTRISGPSKGSPKVWLKGALT